MCAICVYCIVCCSFFSFSFPYFTKFPWKNTKHLTLSSCRAFASIFRKIWTFRREKASLLCVRLQAHCCTVGVPAGRFVAPGFCFPPLPGTGRVPGPARTPALRCTMHQCHIACQAWCCVFFRLSCLTGARAHSCRRLFWLTADALCVQVSLPPVPSAT